MTGTQGVSQSRFSFLADETKLSGKLGFDIGHPVRVFTLQGLDIDGERFIRDLAPTFLLLQWDNYDVKRGQVAFLAERNFYERDKLNAFLADYYADRRGLEDVYNLIARLSSEERWVFERIKPRRKRAIAKFAAVLTPDHRWRIERVPAEDFAQSVLTDDVRSLKRVFKEASEIVTRHPDFQKLLYRVAELVRELRPEVRELTLTMHQVSIFADVMMTGDNSPEGIHQDGADYIISALVVEREGIIGGESIVYGPDKKTEYLRTTLEPGQGIFQADRNTPLWHYVTQIQEDPATPPLDGKRSIFGFDINCSQ